MLEKKHQKSYEVFNLGTGEGSSVLEVIQTFEKVTGQSLNYKIVERREGDVVAAYAETSKAKNELAWKASLSLEDALRSAWKWEQQLQKS